MGLRTKQFESVLNAVPNALVGIDWNGAIRFVNRQTELMFGRDREQMIGHHISVLIPEALWPIDDQHRGDFFADPQSRFVGVHLELSGRHHDGGEFPINVRLSYIDTGDVLLAITAVADVTRHKQAVAKAELLDAIVRYSNEAMMGADLNGIITSWNPAAERLYGYSGQEAIGKDASLLMPEDRADDQGVLLAKIKDGFAVENFETMRVRKDGTVFPVSLSVAPVRDEDGAVVGATAVIRDVTEQREAFQAVQRLAAIVESSDDAIIGKTLDGIITSWNAAAARMYGYSGQEILGKPVELLSPQDRVDEIKDILTKVKAGQGVAHFETERVRKDGTVFPVSLSVSPIRDPGGVVVGASTIARDVTEFRQAVARAQDLIETAPDALVGVDQAGVIQFVNRQTELLFGYDRDALVGQLVETLVPESSRAVHPGHRGSYVEDPMARPMGAGLELTGLRRDGTQFPVDISLSPLQTRDGLLLTAAVRDVTEQRKAFEAAGRLAAIVESTDDAVIGTTLEGIVTTWNAAAERMFGYSTAEIIGKSGSLLDDTDRAEARPAARARIAAGHQVDRFETMLTRKDGTRFPASCTLSGVRDVDGRVVGASLIARDLTEQVQAQKALGETSRQYRLLAENASDLVVMTSPDRVITWVSPSLTRSLGWAVEDLMGKRLLDLVHPDDVAATTGPREAVYSDQEFSTPAGEFLMRFRTKSGQYRWMAGVATPVTDESSVFTGVVSGLRDVDDLVRAREAAEADRATLRATLDSLMDPHVLLEAVRDDRGQIVDFLFADANPAACAYNGIAYEDLVGSRLLEHYPGVVGAGLLKQCAHVVETGEPLRLDDLVYPVETMGGQERHLDIRAARVGDGVSYTWRDVTDRYAAATAEALQVADQQLQELMIKLSRAHEEEREHLSRELHDNLGQILTSASLFAKAASLDLPPERRDLYDKVRSLIDHALASTRSLAWTLRRSEQSQALEGRLKQLVDDVSSREFTDVNLAFRGHGQSVSVRVESVVFRIVQEAITNVLRHAHARHAWIIVTLTGDQVGVVVKDDGIGFDPKSTATRIYSAGLQGMEERARSLGGTLKIDSRPGWGTTVRFDLSSYEADA